MYPISIHLTPRDRIGLVACSNPLSHTQRQEVVLLCSLLEKEFGLSVRYGKILDGQVHTAYQRAKELMELYTDPDVKAIFDVSGGDIANEILPYLDYGAIQAHAKPFFGYSDLTTVINAILQQNGQPSVLYQIRNLVGDASLLQQQRFRSGMLEGTLDSNDIEWKFLQGDFMEGIVAGGNLRCFLKLAGTPYFPELSGRLLFLESLGGGPEQTVTYLCQLKQMGIFDKIAGLLLGTFTKLEEQIGTQTASALICRTVDRPGLPIAKTQQIGHASDSCCFVIGSRYTCRRLT